jgi:hypothetical protein
MLDAMQRRAAEKGVPGRSVRYSLAELDLPADLKEKIADAFAHGQWREDCASVAAVAEQANAVVNFFRHH